MTAFLFILAIIFVMISVAAPIVFLQARKVFREQKNYERGLKIVPLLIHLPPPSDDTEIGNRDVRDVTDETISKAQIIYNIIAGTLKKDLKSSFYGQRHFAFEIIGSQGFVYYYAAVPVALLDVVKQAVNSAYPSARLEEVAEHNIFSQSGRMAGTIGGELTLKENYAHPIATYQDIKRDGMQSLLNAMSTLGKEDGVAVQILMRPADPSWRKKASAVASAKRKGESVGGITSSSRPAGNAIGRILGDAAVALFKPPEPWEEKETKTVTLSNIEQTNLDAIDEKTKHPGFEVVIRIIASSNVTQRAQTLLNNIVASYALYDAPGKNGFKFNLAKDTEGLVTAYLMRFFPQHHNKTILNSVELASLFHFPDQSNIPTSQLSRQDSKQVDGPRNIPDEGLLLGFNLFRGVKKPIRLSHGDRQRHMYVVGQTGTGKSTFLENLALQDMLSGNGFAFVDPHGDVAERLLSMVPKERTEDVIYFSPGDMDYPMGLNLFEFNNPDQKDFLIQEALNMLYKLYDPQHQGIMGPRYEHLFRMAALTIMADPEGGTFVDIPKLFRDSKYVDQKLQHVHDLNVLEFWKKEIPQSQRSNEFGEVTSWFVSKFGAFLSNEMMRNIIGQTKSAFDLRDIMDNKKILLVNLSKGRTGELNSKLLGMVFVMKFQAAAMSRSDIPESERIDFSLYVDEFQNFSTDSFATIMSEARKYRLNLIVANQFTTQLTQEIRDAVFGNMGTIVSFRVGQNDVDSLGQYFQPTFDHDDLLRVPNYNAIVRTLIGGVPTHPFSMITMPPLGTANPRLAVALKQLSAAKYGKPKAVIEKEIFARMATKGEVLTPGVTGAPALPTATSATAKPAPAPAQTGSFLDEWLHKRKKGVVSPSPASPAVAPTPTPAPVSQATPVTSPADVAPVASSQPLPSLTPAFKPAVSPVPDPVAIPTIHKQSNHTMMKEEGGGPSFKPSPVTPAPAPTPKVTPKPQTTHQKAKSSQNISSGALESSEVNKIAAEIKQGLNEPKPLATTTPPPPVPTPKTPPVVEVKPAPVAQPETEPVAIVEPEPEAETPPVDTPKDTPDQQPPPGPGKGDTIYIDNDGVFHRADEPVIPE